MFSQIVKLFFFSKVLIFVAFAQNNPNAVPPQKIRLLNSSFSQGYLVLQDGKKANAFKYNYDLFLKKILFLNDKNDTLIIQDDKVIKQLIIGSDVYQNDLSKGFLKVLKKDSLISLVTHDELYSRKSTTATDEGYGGTTNGTSSSINISSNTKYIFNRTTKYYLLKRTGEIFNANKSGFLKAFPTKDDVLKSYLKSEKIDFEKKDDLEKVFTLMLENK